MFLVGLANRWICVLVAPFRSVPAVPCGDSGNFNGEFCCSLVANTSCCNATFGNVFGKPFAPVTLAATTVNVTNSTDTISITTVTATAIGHSSFHATKVGVGVGVPLGILLLLSLCLATWTERRRRRDMEKVARMRRLSGGQWSHDKTYAGSQAIGMDVLRYEVDGGDGRLPELGVREVHEAAGSVAML